MLSATRLPLHYSRARGFSLIQVSAIIVAAALIMVTMLPTARSPSDATLSNANKLAKVEEAMTAFMLANCRRPCPAGGQYATADAEFGFESVSAGAGDCVTASSAAILGPDAATGNIVAGAIPTRALGMPDDYAVDAYGRRFTYVVDERATGTATCMAMSQSNPTVSGDIYIRNGSGLIVDETMVAYISHGRDGHGAFPIQGSTVAGRFNSGSADTDTLVNAGVDSSFSTNFTNTKVKKEPTTTFDDLVYYRSDAKNTCFVGYRCLPSGFRLDGVTAGDLSGARIATGDVNGDGIADLVIGALGANGYGGYTYVVFGTRAGFPNPLPLSSLDGANGFRIDGVTAGDLSGGAVATGDINGDGVADLIIGANSGNSRRGYTYVVFGKTSGWAATAVLSTGAGNLIDGTKGFRLDGVTADDLSGGAVATGDVNGDGIADLVTGARGANGGKGYTYVVFGKASGWAATATLSTGGGNLIDGTKGFRLDGVAALSFIGGVVATGDVNNDGLADVVLGASNANSGRGYTYIVFGKASGWAATATLNTGAGNLIDGTKGFRLDGVTANDLSGDAVATGDINGDGIADLAIGAVLANGLRGYTYVVFGKASGWTATATLNTGAGNLIDGTKGFRLDGVTASDYSGAAAAAGDVNGDGIADLVIGAPYANGNKGYTYILFGKASGWAATATLNTGAGNLIDGTQGFRLDGVTAGGPVATGDVNGDGSQDVITSAYQANGNAGYIYVLFGRSGSWSVPYNLGGI